MEKMESLLNRDEIRRLEKAAKDKNKMKLAEWAYQFEEQIAKHYEDYFIKELGHSIDNFILTVVYTLHFNENTKFGNKRIADFMDDLFETIDMFRREEAKPEDYRKELEKDKIYIKGSDN